MDSKKILIVTRAFYPDISPRSFRATELVKEFARQGHAITVLTSRNESCHAQFEQQHGVVIKDLGRNILPQINRGEGGRLSVMFKRVLFRLLLMFFEYPDIELMFKVKRALAHEHDYDLMISVAVPHPIHWGVAWERSKSHPVATTWVADCGDPYMGVTYDRFPRLFYFKYLEKWFCRKADFISVPIEGAKEGYYPEFRQKIRVIPQGFDFDEFDFSQSYTGNQVPTFAYAGLFIRDTRDPRALLDWLVSSEQDFKFYIFTKKRELIEPFLARARGRIELRAYLPRADLLSFLSRMDFLVNINNATSRQSPSKLIDYYLTGRPVLSMDSGTVDAGLMEAFFQRDYAGRHVFEKIERYRIDNVCRQFLGLTSTAGG